MIKKLPNDEKLVLNENEWELTFEDNFEFFDKKKWKVNTCINEKDPSRNGIRHVAYCTDDEDIIFTKDNKLHIRTKWKNGKYGEGWYTGFIETSKSVRKEYEQCDDYEGFAQTYGYFECRCKVAKAIGIWSAFWLMPDNEIAFSKDDVQDTGEDGIEIDVMESPHSYRFTEKAKNINIHVLHADGYDDRLKSVKSPTYHVPNMYDEFHTYGVMWDEEKYTFYIDGHKTWESQDVYKGKKLGVSKVDEYLILSTEVGGDIVDGVQHPGYTYDEKKKKFVKWWSGNPEKNDKSKNYDFIVDYVKCYKKK